jgi:Flp pilus assembly pilin Flp
MIEIYVRLATMAHDRAGQADRGATLVEYTLLLAFIVLVCLLAVQFLGNQTSSNLTSTGSSMFG